MAEPHVVSSLKAKREEIERSIAYLEGKLKEARVDLAHVNATLRLFEVGSDPQLQFPAHVDVTRLFRRGELGKLCHEALAASAEPMTTRELALAVVCKKGWDAEDKVLRTSLTYRIVQTLGLQRKRGKIASPGKRTGVRLWALK
jgi:hypothetical protein